MFIKNLLYSGKIYKDIIDNDKFDYQNGEISAFQQHHFASYISKLM